MYSARRQVRPSTCIARVVHISVYQTKERSEVVCQVLSTLSQWPYGNAFHYTHTHRLKSAANTTTKHPHTPNSSQTVTAIHGTEPSWNYRYCFSLSQQTNVTLPHPSYTATRLLPYYYCIIILIIIIIFIIIMIIEV